MRSSPTHRVVLVAFEGFQSLDLFGPAEVFAAASAALGSPAYSLRVAAERTGEITTSSGVAVRASAALGALEPASIDTLVVVGGPGVAAVARDDRVVAEIRRLAAGAARVASVCTGAYLLAEAGLLDGRRVTTHWRSTGHLQEHYPDLTVDPEPIFVHEGRVATSAGVTAGMDLALHFVEQDHGHALALEVARHLVLFLRRPGNQAQLSAPLAAQRADAEPVRRLQAWAAEHLADDLSVARLATQAGQSPRTFARRFHDEVGVTPGRWVESLRLEQARRLLEETGEPVDAVARRCGLRPESLRRLFHRRLGLSPTEYRRRFGRPTHLAPPGAMGASAGPVSTHTERSTR